MRSGRRRAEKTRSLKASRSNVGGYSSSAPPSVPQMAQRVGLRTTSRRDESVIHASFWLVEDTLHDVGRPAFHLIVDVRQIGADNAEADQLHASKEEDQDDH